MIVFPTFVLAQNQLEIRIPFGEAHGRILDKLAFREQAFLSLKSRFDRTNLLPAPARQELERRINQVDSALQFTKRDISECEDTETLQRNLNQDITRGMYDDMRSMHRDFIKEGLAALLGKQHVIREVVNAQGKAEMFSNELRLVDGFVFNIEDELIDLRSHGASNDNTSVYNDMMKLRVAVKGLHENWQAIETKL